MSDLFPEAPEHQVFTIGYSEDEHEVWAWHKGSEDYRLACTCGEWKDRAGGETQATNKGMDHVMKHDAEYQGLEWVE